MVGTYVFIRVFQKHHESFKIIVIFAAKTTIHKMTTITLRYDEYNQNAVDTIGSLINSGLATVEETVPEGSMTLSQFGALLKNGIRKHYENQRSNHSAASQE